MLLLLDVITNQNQQNLTYRYDNRSHIIKLPTLGKLLEETEWNRLGIDVYSTAWKRPTSSGGQVQTQNMCLYFIFVKFKFANNLNWVHLSHLPVLRDDKENRRENHKQIN